MTSLPNIASKASIPCLNQRKKYTHNVFLVKFNYDNFHCLSLIGICSPKNILFTRLNVIAYWIQEISHCHHFRPSNEKCIFRFVLLSKWKAQELCLYCMKRWPPSWFISRQIINKYVEGKVDNWFVSFKTANILEKFSFRLQKCILSYSLRSMCPVSVSYTVNMLNI